MALLVDKLYIINTRTPLLLLFLIIPPTRRWVQIITRRKVAEIWYVLSKGKETERVRPRYDKVGSAETSDFPKDTELEFDSLGMIALEGGTSQGQAAVARSKEQWTWSRHAAVIQLVSEIVSEEKLGQREKWKHKVVDIGRLDDCLCGSWAELTANNVIQCALWELNVKLCGSVNQLSVRILP